MRKQNPMNIIEALLIIKDLAEQQINIIEENIIEYNDPPMDEKYDVALDRIDEFIHQLEK